MLQEEIIEFAKLFVQNVRDSAIRDCDNQLHAKNMNAHMAKRWRDAKNGNMDKFAEMLISDSVDEAVFYFLWAVDEGILNISLNKPDGGTINLTGDIIGELAGEYMGEWRYKYSKERSSNDLL